ncbi:MAG TPA: hypothetical protein V6C81_22775 [Planktothrix sp.]|jgi:hypothetical protein
MPDQDVQLPAQQKSELAPVKFLPIWRATVLAVGSFLAICGFALSAEILVELFGGSPDSSGKVAAMLFFIGIGWVSALACRAQLKERSAIKELNHEQKVLSYAKAENGRGLTVSEVSLNCSMNVSDSLNICNRLAARGLCQVDVSEVGEMLYVFPCFKKQIGQDSVINLQSDLKIPDLQKHES